MSLRGRFTRFVFFGNFFYGICAVALAIETALQQNYPLNGAIFYLLLFCVTVIYYSKAYLTTETSPNASNLRSAWYGRNRRMMLWVQYALAAIFLAGGLVVLPKAWPGLVEMHALEWILLFVFPLASVVYYGFTVGDKSYNIRNIGWLKPFVIGFTWAGLVNVYPIIYHHVMHGGHLVAELSAVFLFVKNFMFISLLCILFDIKDYEMDYNLQLKTFVVKLGAARTIWLVIVPMCLIGLTAFLAYAGLNGFSTGRVLVNTIPFVLLLLLSPALRRERHIFYYLVIIDGLMLVKAGCGIVGVLYF